MVDFDDSFVALGDSTFPVLEGFVCDGTSFQLGGRMTGTLMGLLGQARDPGPGDPGKDLPEQIGIFGTARDGPGLVGTSFGQFGIWGQCGDVGPAPTVKAGIFGTANEDYGIIGTSTRQPGVFGHSTDHAGVVGTSTNSFGVVGQSGNAAALQIERPAAIMGTSSRNTAVAAVSDITPALRAHSGPPHNFGVFRTGAVTATESGNGIGVSALSLKFDGVRGASFGWRGVTGYSSANYGVYGLSFAPPRGPGVKLADAPAGVYGQSMNGSMGVLGVADPTASSGAGVVGVGSPHAPAGYFEGDLIVTGQIFAGVKDATVSFPDGSKRLLHCMESPEHWFEDFGTARLVRGRVTVKLDPDFVQVVKINNDRVFLTPEGDCKGLYVRRHGKSFEVRELQGGTSNIAFSYRIVGKRKDIEAHTRFAKIDTRLPMATRKPRAGRGRKAARALLATLAADTRNKRRK